MGEEMVFHFYSALAVATLGFLLFYFFTFTSFVTGKLQWQLGEPGHVVYQRLTGLLIFGVLPVILILFSNSLFQEFGLKTPTLSTGLWALLLMTLIILINYFNASSPQNLAMYPQIRRNEWSYSLLATSALSWLSYILAYEFLFRGYLLFSSIQVIGLWPAIILNTIIYSLVHFHKGIKEMVGSLPFGIILCYLCYLTGSIWIAVIAHSTMVLSNEWFSIQKNPAIVIKTTRK
ncbi:MAG TPA: CPBP family intramembrane glutamic endopeptidase [Lentimicrobium sp.]|nr:CPBP family intramembrane glutamic endopeptidase [Lentimicrobium sp.]